MPKISKETPPLPTYGVRTSYNPIFPYTEPLLTEQISDSCPWFFEMRELIGERPNIIPTGVGNGSSTINIDDEEGHDEDATQERIEEGDNMEKELAEKAEMLSEGEAEKGRKPTGSGKTSAHEGLSITATRAVKEPSKKRKSDTFADLVGAEEITRQKELEVLKAKHEGSRAKAELKLAELALRTQRHAEEMRRNKEKDERKRWRFMKEERKERERAELKQRFLTNNPNFLSSQQLVAPRLSMRQSNFGDMSTTPPSFTLLPSVETSTLGGPSNHGPEGVSFMDDLYEDLNSTATNAGASHLPQTEQSKALVEYEKRWTDPNGGYAGSSRFTGPVMHGGDPEDARLPEGLEIWYKCTARDGWFQVPHGYIVSDTGDA